MRIIKRKRVPTNENLAASEAEPDPNNETNKVKKNVPEQTTNLVRQPENQSIYRYDPNEQMLNPYFNQQLNCIMPPPPIPPIPTMHNTLIINSLNATIYQQPTDYEKLIAQQQIMLQNQISDNNSMYKLNDIVNLNNQKSSRHSYGGIVTQNHDVFQNCSQRNNNLDPKQVFNNLTKQQNQVEALNTSNLAAKHSSYYSLTPASSTTSLQDLNNSNQHIDNSTTNKRLKSTSNLTNKRRTIGAVKTDIPPILENGAQPLEAAKRKRGRPPKNSIPVEAPVTSTVNTIQKLITSKTKQANLQKSKVTENQNQILQAKKVDIKKEEIVHEAKKNEEKIDEEHQTPLPKLTWTNANELWRVMRLKDTKFKHDHLYLKKHTGIEPQMRAILLDWLIEISYAYRLHRETLHLALEYMDRFLTESKQEMRVDRLQLIGMTSLFLASKVEEIYPPKLKELASHMENYSNNNEEAISQFELFMLKTLNWEISPVTSNTWLMTYLQIASINYSNYLNGDVQLADLSKEHNTHIVMPLNVYKNSSSNPKEHLHPRQQEFYLKSYMKSVTLLDLCLFDMESMMFNYSVLAASAMYHMLCKTSNYVYSSNQLVCNLVHLCSGYNISELDSCIKWMAPYAEVCKEVLGEDKMTTIKQFSSIESDDSHNIQLYYQNLELLKEAQLRKTPSKFYTNNPSNAHILTPPESNRKNHQSSGVM
ncbi:unnamed protein product [Brachionus calyciflorus]|uniref:Uncharacterized protein n=1 Tax=Brachionus calyciflorus TaxID=104777 RepID=A0A813NNU1_9BILA|nr:unnamed protein product [Brachionus calyciflorus]